MKGIINFKLFCITVLMLIVINSCSTSQNETMIEKNVLLSEWTGPYGGVPAFDQMKVEDVKPALEKAMELNLEEIDEITSNTEAPTFENTIIPLEKSGEALSRVMAYYGKFQANMSSPEFREVSMEMAPKLSEHRTKISQNEKLFSRVKAVYYASLEIPLEADQQRVVQLIYERFARNGAELEGEAKERYKKIDKELSSLSTQFDNNVLADEEGYITYITKDQLGGLSESFVNALAEAAKENGKEGQYAIANTRSVVEPFLTFSDERELRKKVWETYKLRGDNGDEHDNTAIIARMLALRVERAKLQGYDNYASWRLENRMAKTPENALDLMKTLLPAALERVKEEVADMQAIANELGHDITIEPWDYLYYAEKVRKAKYDLDSDEVKQYLQMDKLNDAMFFVAGEVFNLEFVPAPEGSVPVYHEDVIVYEVKNKSTGEHVGLWYQDPYTRKGKGSGAWANTLRSYSTFDGKKTVLATNNTNFMKPAAGEAILISWDNASTLFHEFGHSLNYLCSNIKYPTLNNMVWDYVEFQSQILERWLSTDMVINNYLLHYETGEPMPAELSAKIKKASTFNQGYATTEYLASAIVDLMYHTIDDANGLDPAQFEKNALAIINMPREIAMRHRPPHFGHIFAGGYAAGYYSYMWADVLTADAAEMFAEAPGGFYDKEVSAKLVKYMFAARNSMDPAEAFRLFRGRDPKIDALMRGRGFPVPNN